MTPVKSLRSFSTHSDFVNSLRHPFSVSGTPLPDWLPGDRFSEKDALTQWGSKWGKIGKIIRARFRFFLFSVYFVFYHLIFYFSSSFLFISAFPALRNTPPSRKVTAPRTIASASRARSCRAQRCPVWSAEPNSLGRKNHGKYKKK